MRPARLLALLAVVALLAALTITRLANNDVWIHVGLGKWIVEHGRLPERDPFSFAPTRPGYVLHEWLSGVVFYLVERRLGSAGLTLLKALLVAGATGFLVASARRLGARLTLLLPLLALSLYGAALRFHERPHVFSFLFTAVELWLLLVWRERGRPGWIVLVLPALFALWINLHGGFSLGLALLAAFALGDALSTRAPARPAVLLPAALLGCLVNPYGVALVLHPFRLQGVQEFIGQIVEWQRPWEGLFSFTWSYPIFLLELLLLALALLLPGPPRKTWVWPRRALLALCASLPLAALSLWASARWTPEPLRALTLAAAGAMLLAGLLAIRRLDLAVMGAAALFTLVALKHNRFVSDAQLVFLPIAAAWLSAARPREESARSVALAALVPLAAAAAIAPGGYRYDFSGHVFERGLGTGRNLPVCAVEFLAARLPAGKVLTSYQFSGLVIARLGPRMQVAFDARYEQVYEQAVGEEYFAALASAEGMRGYLARHDLDAIVLALEDTPREVLAAAQADGRFAVVHYDEVAVVLARRDAGLRSLEVLDPAADVPLALHPGNAGTGLAEAEALIATCPAQPFGHLYRARALLVLGRAGEALDSTRRALQLDRGNAYAHAELCASLAALGRREEARAACREALRLDPACEPAARMLARPGWL